MKKISKIPKIPIILIIFFINLIFNNNRRSGHVVIVQSQTGWQLNLAQSRSWKPEDQIVENPPGRTRLSNASGHGRGTACCQLGIRGTPCRDTQAHDHYFRKYAKGGQNRINVRKFCLGLIGPSAAHRGLWALIRAGSADLALTKTGE